MVFGSIRMRRTSGFSHCSTFMANSILASSTSSSVASPPDLEEEDFEAEVETEGFEVADAGRLGSAE